MPRRRFVISSAGRRRLADLRRQPAETICGRADKPRRRGALMTQVRVLAGTRKGAFVLTSDEKREKWSVNGPHFGGWEIYHLKGSPVNPNRIYASQSTGWFGQLIQRSNHGGKTWEPVDNKFVYDGVPGTHQSHEGTPH